MRAVRAERCTLLVNLRLGPGARRCPAHPREPWKPLLRPRVSTALGSAATAGCAWTCRWLAASTRPWDFFGLMAQSADSSHIAAQLIARDSGFRLILTTRLSEARWSEGGSVSCGLRAHGGALLDLSFTKQTSFPHPPRIPVQQESKRVTTRIGASSAACSRKRSSQYTTRNIVLIAQSPTSRL